MGGTRPYCGLLYITEDLSVRGQGATCFHGCNFGHITTTWEYTRHPLPWSGKSWRLDHIPVRLTFRTWRSVSMWGFYTYVTPGLQHWKDFWWKFEYHRHNFIPVSMLNKNEQNLTLILARLTASDTMNICQQVGRKTTISCFRSCRTATVPASARMHNGELTCPQWWFIASYWVC